MGFLKDVATAFGPANIAPGLNAARNPPDQTAIEASLASRTPEQRAAYDANMARADQGRAESHAAWAEAEGHEEQHRVLGGPAGRDVPRRRDGRRRVHRGAGGADCGGRPDGGHQADARIGIARISEFRTLGRRGGGGEDAAGGGDVSTVVKGVVAIHPPESSGAFERLQQAAPLSLPVEPADVHVEVLNWEALARAVHMRLHHPPPVPSPFP